MRRILCVAEKNDVAKGVAAILSKGTMTRRDGRSRYNKIYQLQMNLLGQNSLLAITSVSGHLTQLDFGPEMGNWQTVPIGELFDAPIYRTVPDNMKDIERTLKEESSKSEVLVVLTDCDREGENIGAEIVSVCTSSNRNLDVYRARFSEISPQAINRAMATLGRLDRHQVDAVDCRSELDLRIGAAFTRLQTLHLRKKTALFATGEKAVVSYGSCQFPTLGFVVERYKEIEQFVAEPFWKLAVDVNKNGTKTEFHWDRGRLFDKDAVDVLFDECRDGKVAVVEDVTCKPKTRWRPVALDTVEFEKLAVRKLKLSAKTAMTIAEKLYSQGWISYPRTETNKYSSDMDLMPFVQNQLSDAAWGDFASEVYERGPNPRNGNKSDEAHPPIHPLKYATKDQLQANEYRVYELVVRHFLACLSWDAKGQETVVKLRLGGESFAATGLQVEDLGYMRVYPFDKWSDKVLTTFNSGEEIRDFLVRIANGTTTPPLLLNEADLIALMDKFGIGTDATHAEHIEKLKERRYVGLVEDNRFLPGYLGLALVDAYNQMGYALNKPLLRADLERKLEAICQGTMTKEEVLQEQREKYRKIFEETQMRIDLLSSTLTKYLNSNNPVRPGITTAAGRGAARGGRIHQAVGGAPVAQVPAHAVPRNNNATRGRGRKRADAAPRAGNLPSTDKMCACGAGAVQKTVNKEGPNKGRRFWTCAKPMGAVDKCNFFEWA